jgi:hypothetical protein
MQGYPGHGRALTEGAQETGETLTAWLVGLGLREAQMQRPHTRSAAARCAPNGDAETRVRSGCAQALFVARAC